MLTLRETGQALTGIWQLAHFDPQGMVCFDRSLEGFWRSFRVAVLVAPAYALLIFLQYVQVPIETGWVHLILVEGIAYVVRWVAFPLAAFHVSQLLDRDAEYVGYIVAYNWSSILQIAVYLPVTLLAIGRVLPEGISDLLLLFAMLGLLAVSWFITKTALRIGGLAATGVVALDVAISLVITGMTAGMVA